ncbi:MAG: cytochrome ubiquinol oxidase subunit I, partial [SAR202 cluster bacterium]|nr:cytochrome ubiquinol oxidase subunit I [SAR202 cluster bacterium]
VITVALIELVFDRAFGFNFFNVTKGADPILWQHLFWVFGHPEVYILILPAMGIVSEVLPTFARKPLFGYMFIVFSGITIGVMGWMVWAHHMFTVGMGPVANTLFTLTTITIAVPTGVKIFNWIGTLWGGSIDYKTAMLWAVGFIAMFILGGLSGLMHAISPSDGQQQDTYFIVAHIHYVLFGGAIFGVFSGIYYWFPKATGRLLNEGLGKLHFSISMVGFNITFFPQHFLGLNGMPRRQSVYAFDQGWDLWNMVSTIGVFLLAASLLVFIYNFIKSARSGEQAGPDPWDGRTLEWAIPSPPPEHNFDEIPAVHSRDAFWEQKHPHTVAVPAGGATGQRHEQHGSGQPHGGGHGTIHMPNPSYWPLLVSIGIGIAGYGLIYLTHRAPGAFSLNWAGFIAVVVGVAFAAISVFGWYKQPASGPEH